MPRIYTQKCRKAGKTCGRCGTAIMPGDVYKSTSPGFRQPPIYRCSDPACSFRQSELTQSKMSSAYAAIEDAHEQLRGFDVGDADPNTPDAFFDDHMQPILDDVASQIRDVAEEYREASDQWAGGQGHEEWTDRADTLEAAADEAESYEPSGNFDPETLDDDADVDAEFREWVQEVVDEVSSHLDDLALE